MSDTIHRTENGESLEVHFNIPFNWVLLPHKLSSNNFDETITEIANSLIAKNDLDEKLIAPIKLTLETLAPEVATDLASLVFIFKLNLEIVIAVISITMIEINPGNSASMALEPLSAKLQESQDGDLGARQISTHLIGGRDSLSVNRWSIESGRPQEINEYCVYFGEINKMVVFSSSTSSFDHLEKVSDDITELVHSFGIILARQQ